MTQGLRGRKKISTKFKYYSDVGKVKRRGFKRRGQKRNRGKRGGEMRNGQEKRRRRRRRRRKEKKINLLLFWTDIEKKNYIYNQLDSVCPANPEIEKT